MKINSNSVKNVAIIVLLLGVVTAGGIAWWEHNLRTHAEHQQSRNVGTVKAAAELVKTYQDEQMRGHNVHVPNYVTIHDTIAIRESAIDSTVDALNISRKQVQRWEQIATVTQAKYLAAQDSLDRQQRLVHYYKDKYLDLSYRPGKDSTDKGGIDFKYNAQLTVTPYSKRKWLLGSKQSFIDIYSQDIRTTVNGVKTLTIKQKMPEFGLRLQARAIYSLTRDILYPGVGFEFDYKRASILGYSYYDASIDSWRPSLGVKFDIARF